jgi:hypothetical protein
LRWAALWAKPSIGIALAFWALRHKFELDIPMDRHGKLIRATTVLACWALASLPIEQVTIIRVARGLTASIGLAVLCWPNLVVHVMRWLGRPVALPEEVPSAAA